MMEAFKNISKQDDNNYCTCIASYVSYSQEQHVMYIGRVILELSVSNNDSRIPEQGAGWGGGGGRAGTRSCVARATTLLKIIIDLASNHC